MNRKRLGIAGVVGVLLLLVATIPALAYGHAAGFAVSDFATGFFTNDTANGVGPVGLAFDSSNHLYVMEYSRGYLYKFDSSGGAADDQTRVEKADPVTHQAQAISGAPAGIAFAKDGHLYVALQASSQVAEISLVTGEVTRTLANDICGATGIATDPISGDLFVTSPFCSVIYRISNFSGAGTPTVATYTEVSDPDGITFGSDGTMYVASGGRLVKVSGTNSAHPGTVTVVAESVPTIDGTALAASSDASKPPFIFGNRNDHKITKIDLTTNPPTLTDIVTEGSRGDFAAVGPDGCLYATQSATVAKVTNADGSCSLAPTSAVPQLTLTPAHSTASVGTSVTLTATLSNVTSPNGTAITFTRTGANPGVGTATANSSGKATFTYSGTHTGSDTVTASAAVNEQAVTSNPVTVTWTAAAATPTPAATPRVLPATGAGPQGGVDPLAVVLGTGVLVLLLGGSMAIYRRRSGRHVGRQARR